MCTTIAHSSFNVLAVEANYKVLSRWYLIPSRTAKSVPSYLPISFRGCAMKDTFKLVVGVWGGEQWPNVFGPGFISPCTRLCDPLLAKTLSHPYCVKNQKPVPKPNFSWLCTVCLTASKKVMVNAWKIPTLLFTGGQAQGLR